MPIAELPRSAISAIGATSALLDSSSVIKELLDNALDALATSIVIEISQNGLDVLQVKDNGSGIDPEDRKLACKPNCTSKINSLDDLRDAGPKFLGFRGLALASIAEMSGGVLVTTRVNEEPVGSRLKYDRTGELVGCESAAHPVGTTVRVCDFLQYLPVRRKAALKASSKAISKIKTLLQAYAMARPAVRLSLRVLGGKSDSGWSYPAKQGSILADAVLLVAGADVASQCVTKTTALDDFGRIESRPDLADGWDANSQPMHISVMLPRSDSGMFPFSNDPTRINRQGQYISIDGRPLSPEKGVAKALVKIYKSYLRAVAAQSDQTRPSIVDPFLCLQLSCPPGTYDPNVEPAKDDVLLSNCPEVLSAVEKLFKEVYGDCVQIASGKGCSGLDITESDTCNAADLSSSNISGYPTTPRYGNATSTTRRTGGIITPTDTPLAASLTSGSMRRLNLTETSASNDPVAREVSRHPQTPWTLAKLNAAASIANRASAENPSSPLCDRIRGVDPPRDSGKSAKSVLSPIAHANPPSSFGGSNGSPVRRGAAVRADAATAGGGQNMHSPCRNGTLDSWMVKTSSRPTQDQLGHLAGSEEEEQIPVVQLSERFGPGANRNLHVRSSCSSISQSMAPILPAATPGAVTNGSAPISDPPDRRVGDSQGNLRLPPVEEVLEFERRKKEAIRYQRELTNSHTSAYAFGAQSGSSLGFPAPSKPRQTSHTSPTPDINKPSTFPAVQGRRSPNQSLSKLKATTPLHLPETQPTNQIYGNPTRIMSSQVPLEHIPESSATHHISTKVECDLAHILCFALNLAAFDTYIANGKLSCDELQPWTANVALVWKEKLLGIIRRRFPTAAAGFDLTLPLNLEPI